MTYVYYLSISVLSCRSNSQKCKNGTHLCCHASTLFPRLSKASEERMMELMEWSTWDIGSLLNNGTNAMTEYWPLLVKWAPKFQTKQLPRNGWPYLGCGFYSVRMFCVYNNRWILGRRKMIELGGADLGKGEHSYTTKTLALALLLRYLLLAGWLLKELMLGGLGFS